MKELKLRPVEQANYGKWKRIKYSVKNQPQKIKYKVMEDMVFNNEQLMQFLKISRRDLRTLRDKGIIEFNKIDGKCLYRMSGINKMLDTHKNHIIFRRKKT
jgi:hypothetical protein